MTRTISTALAAGAGAIFVVLAAVLVPWQPVPGGAPDPLPADSLFTAEQIARAEAYARTARALSWASLAVSLFVSGLLGFTSLGARLLGRRTPPWPLAVVGLVVLVLALGRLVTLPFGYLLHRHRLQSGLSTQTAIEWLVDQVKGYGIGVLGTSIALLVLVGCARRWRTWWPVIAGGVSAVLVVLGSFVYPLVVEPAFNDFRPLPAGELRTAILDVAAEERVSLDEVLVADASRRTTSLNAYVSGIGSSRRVVLYDTLVESESDDRVLAVVAHELAHVAHHDVVVGTALGAVGVLAGVGLLGLAMGSSRLRRRAGIGGMADPRSVAVVLALVAVAGLISAPIQNGISRKVELRADVVALESTGDGVAFLEMQQELCLRALCDPTPPAWSHRWFGSHPTILERAALAIVAGEIARGGRTDGSDRLVTVR